MFKIARPIKWRQLWGHRGTKQGDDSLGALVGTYASGALAEARPGAWVHLGPARGASSCGPWPGQPGQPAGAVAVDLGPLASPALEHAQPSPEVHVGATVDEL